MSDKPQGFGAGHCDVCGRKWSWGCGHTGSQERDARRHRATRTHKARACECFGHDHCDPKTCKLAGIQIRGYIPYHQHTEPAAGGAGARHGERRAPRSSRRAKSRRSR